MASDAGWVWTVEVGWTSTRPVRPDEHTSYVTVAARNEAEAVLVAAQMVAAVPDGDGRGRYLPSGRPGCVMPTRTRILYATW